MKKRNFISKVNKRQKIIYLILIGLAIISIITGILFIFTLNKDNTSLINQSIDNYFNNEINYLSSFFKSIFNNFSYILVMWILGISIIGIPLILFMFIFKSFLLGFSISSIISTYGIKGFLYIIIYLIPNKLIFLIVLLLISFYSISFSIKLLKSFFTKKTIDFKVSIAKYLKILLISLIITLFISLYDGVISIYLLKLFNI